MGIPVNNFSVYMHKNKINNKVYIGVTKQKPEKRFDNGYGYKYSNKEFWEDINKYGWNSFEHIVLHSNLSREEVSKKEEELVKKYDSTNPIKGYNKIDGGFRARRPDIAELMRKRIGVLNPNFGKKAPLKTKKALTNYAKNGQFGINNHNATPILQFDKKGKFIKEYKCEIEAIKELGVNSNHIPEVCNGKRKTFGGFIWKYKEGEVV